MHFAERFSSILRKWLSYWVFLSFAKQKLLFCAWSKLFCTAMSESAVEIGEGPMTSREPSERKGALEDLGKHSRGANGGQGDLEGRCQWISRILNGVACWDMLAPLNSPVESWDSIIQPSVYLVVAWAGHQQNHWCEGHWMWWWHFLANDPFNDDLFWKPKWRVDLGPKSMVSLQQFYFESKCRLNWCKMQRNFHHSCDSHLMMSFSCEAGRLSSFWAQRSFVRDLQISILVATWTVILSLPVIIWPWADT